jgi:hypothetical protein
LLVNIVCGWLRANHLHFHSREVQAFTSGRLGLGRRITRFSSFFASFQMGFSVLARFDYGEL